jgi:rhodanese-related sulfurtransferase
MTVADVLAAARSRITRYTPAEAAAADALIVDLRSHDERYRNGVIPGSLHVPRSVLEWRCDSTSGFANPLVAEAECPLILVCAEGYSSSLAAAALLDLGVREVGDLEGGYAAWSADGLPTIEAPPIDPGLPGMGEPC